MEKFLGTYSLPKVNQEEIDHLNGPIPISETESVIKFFKISLKTKVQDWMVSQGNSTKYINNLNQSFSKSSKRLKRRKHSQSRSMKPQSPRYQNQHYQKRKLHASIFDEYRCKNPQ